MAVPAPPRIGRLNLPICRLVDVQAQFLGVHSERPMHRPGEVTANVLAGWMLGIGSTTASSPGRLGGRGIRQVWHRRGKVWDRPHRYQFTDVRRLSKECHEPEQDTKRHGQEFRLPHDRIDRKTKSKRRPESFPPDEADPALTRTQESFPPTIRSTHARKLNGPEEAEQQKGRQHDEPSRGDDLGRGPRVEGETKKHARQQQSRLRGGAGLGLVVRNRSGEEMAPEGKEPSHAGAHA